MNQLRIHAGLALAAMAVVTAASPVQATVYTSLLEYKDTGSGVAQGGPYGKVTLDEVDANTIDVTVTLFSPEVGFLNTGTPSNPTHEPFVFNLTGDYPVTVTNATGQTFYDAGFDSNTTADPNFTSVPFGNFTNKIGCCGDKNGASHKSLPPITFSVYDANGITFAGIGAQFDPVTGKLISLGTGDHFLSNSGGWWFAADVVDNQGNTFNVAARDAYGPLTSPVPEPATWAMMVAGFGLIGVALRSRRTKTSFA